MAVPIALVVLSSMTYVLLNEPSGSYLSYALATIVIAMQILLEGMDMARIDIV